MAFIGFSFVVCSAAVGKRKRAESNKRELLACAQVRCTKQSENAFGKHDVEENEENKYIYRQILNLTIFLVLFR